MKKKSTIHISILVLCLLTQSASLFADTELDERWIRAKQEAIFAKEARTKEIAQHSEIIQRQMTEERKYIQESHERLWQDFSNSVEFERRTVQEKLAALDERQSSFERELEKKRAQDEMRIKERENEVQRLISETERLRAEIKIDKAQLDQRIEELTSQKDQIEKVNKDVTKREMYRDGEIADLSQDAIHIGQVSGQGIYDDRPFNLQKTSNEYYVEVGDVIGVEVWRVSDLTRDFAVRPDGRISMPLAGDIEVAGLSLTELREVITEKIKSYVIEPQVSISIRSFGGRKFIIMGEVRGPGVYRYDQTISLIEAIALAGGFSDQAKSGQVMIIRGDIRKEPKVQMIKANMQNLLRHGMLTENLMIKQNDIIYVGRDFFGDYNSLISEVLQPGISQTVDFFVLRDAIRRVQNRPR